MTYSWTGKKHPSSLPHQVSWRRSNCLCIQQTEVILLSLYSILVLHSLWNITCPPSWMQCHFHGRQSHALRAVDALHHQFEWLVKWLDGFQACSIHHFNPWSTYSALQKDSPVPATLDEQSIQAEIILAAVIMAVQEYILAIWKSRNSVLHKAGLDSLAIVHAAVNNLISELNSLESKFPLQNYFTIYCVNLPVNANAGSG